jgi:hypothetical protein
LQSIKKFLPLSHTVTFVLFELNKTAYSPITQIDTIHRDYYSNSPNQTNTAS